MKPITATADPMLGRVLGERYRLVARIGEGGMGTVYRAEHVVLRKRMAVKVLRPHLSHDEELVRRFHQEAIAASEIGQENIVDVTDFGRTPEGAVYLVMEELEGTSLAALLAESGPLPVERAALVLAQVCRALAAAHAHGIVHRDLKPDNVIVVRREDGTDFVKVVDFGVSKTGGGRSDRQTRAGMIIGTPEYMAPEQGAAATVDHRADVYAFGVLAYELVTGSLPFQGETAIATLIAHQSKPVEPPSRRRPGLVPAFEALILKALEKRPEARHQSMAELAADLTRVLAGFGLPPVYERAPAPPPSRGPLGGLTERFVRGPDARAAHPSGKGLPSPERGATVALDSTEQRAVRSRRRAVVAVGAATVVAFAGLTALLALRAPRVASDRGPAGSVRAEPFDSARDVAAGYAQDRLRPAQPAVVEARTTPTPTPTPTSTPTATPVPMNPEKQAAPPARTVRTARSTASPRGSPAPTSAARAGKATTGRASPDPGRQVGDPRETGDNPYRKLDDLKPDPF